MYNPLDGITQYPGTPNTDLFEKVNDLTAGVGWVSGRNDVYLEWDLINQGTSQNLYGDLSRQMNVLEVVYGYDKYYFIVEPYYRGIGYSATDNYLKYKYNVRNIVTSIFKNKINIEDVTHTDIIKVLDSFKLSLEFNVYLFANDSSEERWVKKPYGTLNFAYSLFELYNDYASSGSIELDNQLSSDRMALSPMCKELPNEYSKTITIFKGYPISVQAIAKDNYTNGDAIEVSFWVLKRDGTHGNANWQSSTIDNDISNGDIFSLSLSDGDTGGLFDTMTYVNNIIYDQQIVINSVYNSIDFNCKFVDKKCGIYLRSVNHVGGVSYYLFDGEKSDKLTVKSPELRENNQSNEFSKPKYLNVNEPSLMNEIVISNELPTVDMPIILDIINSPIIELYLGEKGSGDDEWLNVKVSDSTIQIYDNQDLFKIKFSIIV